MTTGLYVSGTTIVHRLPPGPKFGALFVIGIILFVLDSTAASAAATALALLVLLSCRLPWRTLRARLTPLVWMLGCFFALTAVLQNPHTAELSLLRLLAVLLLALAVTMTTPPAQVLDLFERLAGGLRYLGVRDTERIGLSIALVLRFVPEVHRHFLEHPGGAAGARAARQPGRPAGAADRPHPEIRRRRGRGHRRTLLSAVPGGPFRGEVSVSRPDNRVATRDVVLVALFAAIIIALGLIPPLNVGFIAVPITMQTLGVMLAGAVLGSVRGMLACALVVLLTAAGLPVLSGGRGGLGVFAGPTAGYLVGWMPGALVTGLIAQFWAWRLTLRRLRIVALFIAAVVGGIAVVYAVGIPWLSANTGIPLHKAFSSGMVFVPGDLLKAAIVALVADGVLRSYRVLPTRPRAAAR